MGTMRSKAVGIVNYRLGRPARHRLRIGDVDCTVGVLSRLRGPSGAEAMEQTLRYTPPAVIVEDPMTFGDSRVRAFRVLGWDRGREVTQDLDWDHLPCLGYAVPDQGGGFTLHELVDQVLVPVSQVRAGELGILTSRGQVARTELPVIAQCDDVKRMAMDYYKAICRFQDGRTGIVLGKSEHGTMPEPGWFVGRNTLQAARFEALHMTVDALQSSSPMPRR
jgi:hypothetical protein